LTRGLNRHRQAFFIVVYFARAGLRL